jgi:hypothetical protein
VQKLLEQHYSGVRNLQFTSDDDYALEETLDNKWGSGGLFTIVLAADGKMIYQEMGEIGLLELRRAILTHLPDGAYIGNSSY